MTSASRPSQKYSRPFPNAHWTLAGGALLAFLWVFFAGDVCDRHSMPFLAPMFAAVAVVCLWLADLRREDRRGWRRAVWVGWQGIGDLIFFCTVLFGVVFILLLPQGTADCVTDRVYTSEVLQLSAGIKTEISERATARGTLAGSGVGVAVPASPDTPAFGLVSNDGVILWAIPRSGAVVILTPFLVDGSVNWRCQGRPEKVVPSACRS